jgi:hypothetical protein
MFRIKGLKHNTFGECIEQYCNRFELDSPLKSSAPWLKQARVILHFRHKTEPRPEGSDTTTGNSCQIVTLPSGRGSEECTERSWLDKGHLRFDQHQDPPLQREYRQSPWPPDAREFHCNRSHQQWLQK